MRTRQAPIFLAAWFIPLLIAVAALALPTAGEAAGTGAIEGTVTGEGSGALSGIEVCAETLVGEEFGCAMTSALGVYEITGLGAGEYKVEFWPGQLNFVRQFYNDKSTWAEATPVTITLGATKNGVDALLARGAKISGTVIAASTGLPAAGVEVCAFGIANNGTRCDASNGSGAYTIPGLAGGEYEVFFEPAGNGQGLLRQAYPNGFVTVSSGGEVNGINAALQTGGQIAGTVRLAATNAPLAGVRVCLTEAEPLESLGCLTTGPSGTYRFFGLWAAAFKVAFSAEPQEIEDEKAVVDPYPTQWWNGQPTFAAATPLLVTPPATLSGIDAHLGPPPVTTTTTPPAAGPPASSPAPTAVTPKIQPVKCRTGFLRRKVHGKSRCVKRPLHPAHHRHHSRHKKGA